MNSVLGNAILAFLESSKGGTVADLRRFLLEAPFRKEFLGTVQDPDVIYYWEHAFPVLKSNSVGPLTTRLSAFPRSLRRTITFDNGSENWEYETIKNALGINPFFAHAYASWERGTNENTNGLIRWYYPKGTDFATVSDDEIVRVETALNNRPRKRLRWKTPAEVFYQHCSSAH